MHTEMWLNSATVANVEILRERGFVVINPDVGRMTGSDVGVGRYPESEAIIAEIDKVINQTADLIGKKILITAGGTREPIDPIRFIGNRSSGKQGFALAMAAASRGAQVHLVIANSDLPNIDGITTTSVETAEEMATILNLEFPHCDALIMSAAVADARVVNYSEGKIRKEALDNVELAKNPDILKSLAQIKRPGQIVVGFAAETLSSLDLLQKSGHEKLSSKNLNLIYVNDVSDGAIFGQENTKGIIIDDSNNVITVPEISKDTLADILLDQLVSKLG